MDDLILLLNSDPIKNISTLGFICNNPGFEYFIENNSALVLGKSDHLWAIVSSSSEKELAYLLEKHHHKTNFYYSVEDWMIPLIGKYGEVEWSMTTNRYILDADCAINQCKTKPERLLPAHSEYIFNNVDYKEYTSMAHFEDRLNRDISAGIFVGDRPVAWALTHDDGALGCLYVQREYRSRGFAKDITLDLCWQKRLQQKPVFLNIAKGNAASTRLVEKIGFRFDRRLSWLKLR